MNKRAGLFLLLLALVVSTAAQKPADSVDFSRIRQKSVRGLVRKENVRSVRDFQCLNTSCYQEEDSLHFRRHLKTYRIKAGIEQVWKKYSTISPREAWTGRMVNFGFLFSRFKNAFVYPENASEPMTVGSIIYVNLRLLSGIKNLGVAFEVTALDPQHKVIRFCYLKDGVSRGTQEISFTPTADGETLVTHDTHYRSNSNFRDKELYPRFHELLVGEFHENLRRVIEGH